jgi:uncharacterized protein YjbJ (UPF0337 family)
MDRMALNSSYHVAPGLERIWHEHSGSRALPVAPWARRLAVSPACCSIGRSRARCWAAPPVLRRARSPTRTRSISASRSGSRATPCRWSRAAFGARVQYGGGSACAGDTAPGAGERSMTATPPQAPARTSRRPRDPRESPWTRDRIEGAAKQARGTVKQAVGKAAGDAKLQAEGKPDQAAGKLQNAVGGLKNEIRKI